MNQEEAAGGSFQVIFVYSGNHNSCNTNNQ